MKPAHDDPAAEAAGPSTEENVTTVDPYQAIQRKRLWRPLDVQRHSEGYQRLTGWILVILFALATGALLVVYEVRTSALLKAHMVGKAA